MHWHIITLVACTIFGGASSQTACPTSRCSPSTIQVASSASSFRSPCHPNNYANNMNCRFILNPAQSSFTQITIESFDFESWYDYLKFDGPANFVVFANSSTNKVIVTGYPNATINARMATDVNKTLSGFAMSVTKVTDVELLAQYAGYRNMSAALVMRSPLYVTSFDDHDQTNKMDVMLMNLPNTTHAPVATWTEYVGMVGQGNVINVTEITATGFKLTWTEIQAATFYTVIIADNVGKGYVSKQTSTNAFTVNHLPSGTWFNIIVKASNKVGSAVLMTSNTTTDVTNPTGLSVAHVTQNMATVSWIPVNGATKYEVYITDAGSRNAPKDASNLSIVGLTPGKPYTLNLIAIFPSGKNATALPTVSFKTAPGNVSGVTVSNVRTTTIDIAWNQVPGAQVYQLSVDKGQIKNVSSTSTQLSGLSPGTRYSGNITAFNTGRSFPTGFIFTTDLLDSSHWISLVAADSSAISVSWSVVSGAASYNILLFNSTGTVQQNETLLAVTQKVFTGLLPGRIFKVTVNVEDSIGRHHPLNTLSANTSRSTVTGLKIDLATQTTITYSWDNIPGVISYEAMRNDTQVSPTAISPSKDSGLQPGTLYKFGIIAVFETGENVPVEVYGWTVPGNVTVVTIFKNSTTSVKVSWNLASGASLYEMALHNVSSKNVTGSTAMLDDLIPGTTYGGSITPIGVWRGFAKGFTFLTDLLNGSHALWVNETTSSSITVEWTEILAAKEYHLQLTNSNGQVAYDRKLKFGATWEQITGLLPGRRFNITVKVLSNNNEHHSLNNVTAATNKLTVTGLKIDMVTQRTISYSWESVLGAISYKAIRNDTLVTSTASSTYKDIGLLPGTLYRFGMSAVFKTGDAAPEEIYVWTVPDNVTAITVSKISTTSVQVSWNLASGASSYEIALHNVLIKNLTGNVTTLSGLTPGTTYDGSITPIGAWRGFQENFTFSTGLLDGSHALWVKNTTSSSITVEWTEISAAKEYHLQLANSSGLVVYHRKSNFGATTEQITGLLPGRDFRIIVKVLSNNNKYHFLNNVTAATNKSTVTGLHVDSATQRTVSYSWNSIHGAMSYWAIRNGTLHKSAVSSPYKDSSLQPGTLYKFGISAVFETGEAPPEEIYAWTVPDNVSTVTVSEIGTTSAKVSWNLASGASSYEIALHMVKNATGNSITLGDLTPGTKYDGFITPIGAWRGFPKSFTFSTELLNGSHALWVSERTSSSITVKWHEVSGATEYHLEMTNSSGLIAYNTTLQFGVTLERINGLLPGRSFSITVKVLSSDNKYHNLNMVNANTSIPEVTGLKIEIATQRTITYSWDSVAGVKAYKAMRNDTLIDSAASSPYKDGVLQPGNFYKFGLIAVFDIGEANPVEVYGWTVPGNVTAVKISKRSTTSVQVSWNFVNGASFYEIVLNKVSNKNVTGTTATFNGLTPGTNYSGSITAIAVQQGFPEKRSFPEIFTFSTDLLNGSHALWVKKTTSSSITVEWSGVQGAREYHLQLTDSSGKVTRNKTLESGVTTERIEGLPSGRNFSIMVKALSNSNKYHFLNTVTDTTNTTTVTGIRSSSTTTSITFSWANIPEALTYKVYFNGVLNSTGASTHYILEGLDPGSFYKIEVAAKFEIGDGKIKEMEGWTIPAKVAGLQVPENQINTTEFKATWNSRPNIVYLLSLRTHGKETYEYTNAESGGTYPADPGKEYTLAVKAKNTAGEGDEATIVFRTKLESPKISKNSISKFRFQLKWPKVDGATGYRYKCGSMSEVNTFDGYGWLNELNPGTTYHCNVTAYSEFVSSAQARITVKTSQASCTHSTCQNQGVCSESEQDFHCACTSSYTGRNCEEVVDWCGTGGYNKSCDPNSQCTNNPELGKGVCTCNDGFTGDATVKCIGFCGKREIKHRNESLTFPFTFAGMTVYSNESCGERSKASIVCSANATGAAQFDIKKLIYVSCNQTVSNVIRNTSMVKNASTEDIKRQTEELQVLTAGIKVEEHEVEEVAKYFEGLSETVKHEEKKVTTQILANVANAVDNLIATKSMKLTQPTVIDTPSVTLGSTQSPVDVKKEEEEMKKKEEERKKKEKEIKKKILTSLNSLAQQVEIPENKTEHVITTPTMVLKVMDAPKEKNEPVSFSPVIAKSVSSGNVTRQETVQPVRITIPPTAIQKGSENSNTTLRISFFLHRDISLFPAPPPSPNLIVSANLGIEIAIVNLKDKVTMKYDEKEKPGAKTKVENNRFQMRVNRFKCVYWDERTGDWLTRGCCLNGVNASDLTKCECDHLTNFALIVAKDNLKADVPLEITSSVGLGLSIAGLVLTIIIHAIKEDVRTRRPTQILFNICFNLLVANGLFVAGINKTTVKNQCATIASFMHFFYLASWTWMTVYAYDMYRSLVLVFGGGKSHYMTKCALFGYGIPLLITLFDAGFSFAYVDPYKRPEGVCDIPTGYQHLDGLIPKKSAYLADNNCWIHEYSLYFGFLFPVGVMLAFNTFVYSMVIKTLLQRGKGVQSSAKKTSIKDNILISITLTSSTGIAWVAGYFMLISDNEDYLTVMSWIFALLNTAQGVVIFLSTCVRNENMRKVWIEPITSFFSSTSTRIRLLSRRSDLFDTSNTKSEMGTSSLFSTSEGTKDTTAKSVSVKEMTSESAL